MAQKVRNIICGNCNRHGHDKKSCYDPITSYGIICIKFDVNDETLKKLIDKFTTNEKSVKKIISKRDNTFCYYHNKTFNITGTYGEITQPLIRLFCEEDEYKFHLLKQNIKFLMIERKTSLGYLEFIRGNYDIYNFASIKNLFRQMTQDEINNIGKNEYDDLLLSLYNQPNKEKNDILNDIFENPKLGSKYKLAREKFNYLKNKNLDETYFDLHTYVINVKPKWFNKEWGFPKGKKLINKEPILDCACREFTEETGINKNDYIIFNKLSPIEENLIGTNDISYKHVYFIAMITNNNIILDNQKGDFYETGDLKWMTFEESQEMIRPYHLDKKKIINCIYSFFLNNLIHNN